jgi:sulfite reductase alpha subunit-like flavoprotein
MNSEEKKPQPTASAPNWNLINRRWHANFGMLSALTLGIIAISCFTIAHKVKGGVGHVLKTIHTGKFLPEAWQWLWIDSQGLLLGWLIFSGWYIHHKSRKRGQGKVAVDSPNSLLILFDASVPQCHKWAHELSRRLTAAKITAALMRCEDHLRIDWGRVARVAILTDPHRAASTQVERFLTSPKAPKLKGTRYAELALLASEGSSAPEAATRLCGEAMTRLGATPLLPAVFAREDEDSIAFAWMDQLVQSIQGGVEKPISPTKSSLAGKPGQLKPEPLKK